jgi:hypothetical protein
MTTEYDTLPLLVKLQGEEFFVRRNHGSQDIIRFAYLIDNDLDREAMTLLLDDPDDAERLTETLATLPALHARAAANALVDASGILKRTPASCTGENIALVAAERGLELGIGRIGGVS